MLKDRFPSLKDEASFIGSNSPSEEGYGTVTYLDVEDDSDNCVCTSDVIANLGYQVEVVCDGPAALVLAQQQSYQRIGP